MGADGADVLQLFLV